MMAEQTKLIAHFQKMQEACANYLEPTTYIARRPSLRDIGDCKFVRDYPMPDASHAPEAARSINARRDAAFISDMIYMLDCPEEREAMLEARK